MSCVDVTPVPRENTLTLRTNMVIFNKERKKGGAAALIPGEVWTMDPPEGNEGDKEDDVDGRSASRGV